MTCRLLFQMFVRRWPDGRILPTASAYVTGTPEQKREVFAVALRAVLDAATKNGVDVSELFDRAG